MAFSWKNLFGTNNQAAIPDIADPTKAHPTAVLIDPATGQPAVGGQQVNILPFVGDQSGGTVAIPAASASAATALPATTARLHIWSDVACYVRFGSGAVAATTASFPLMAGVPYDVGIRAAETYVSVYGMGTAGTLRWGRLDAS